MWNAKQNDTCNKKENFNNLRIIQQVPEQHTGKSQYVVKELNETATQGTAHLLREVLTYSTKVYG